MPVPFDTRAERTIISGLLRNWKWTQPLITKRGLKLESFYHWHHRLVFKRLSECTNPGPYSLYSALRARREDTEWTNLPRWIAEVWDEDPTGCNCEYAATLVVDAASVRKLIHAANEMLRDAHDRWGPANELIAAAANKLLITDLI